MAFKELPKLQKWYLKYANRPAYDRYKKDLADWKNEQFQGNQEREREEAFRQKAEQNARTYRPHAYKQVTSFKHSGNSGDIIYSLPAVFELSKKGKAHFYLHLHTGPGPHPMGNVVLTNKMADMLKPLLLLQPQIERVAIYNGEEVDYNLDEFREYIFYPDRGSLVRSYLTLQGISYNTSLPWLHAPKDNQYADHIVIARSARHRSPMIDYSFLKKYPKKLFLGIPEEYEEMKKILPDLVYKPVADFLEMATVINSCRFFVGNQSFPFSLAEALKATRLLEVYYHVPNVIVEGEGANDFIYQSQFEAAVQRLFEQTAH